MNGSIQPDNGFFSGNSRGLNTVYFSSEDYIGDRVGCNHLRLSEQSFDLKVGLSNGAYIGDGVGHIVSETLQYYESTNQAFSFWGEALILRTQDPTLVGIGR